MSIGRQLGSPVESPAVLPKQPSHLYAYAEVDIKTGNYTIFLDSQPDCKGAHYCNVGSYSTRIAISNRYFNAGHCHDAAQRFFASGSKRHCRPVRSA
jgi:hypothetical protein